MGDNVPERQPPMSKTPEFVTFERSAKALLRKVTKYATEGGDHLGTGADNTKIEKGLYAARDKLIDSMRRLGLTEDVKALELALEVKIAVSTCRDLAVQVRQAKRAVEIKALDAQAVAARQWRIENGLEDPPKRY